jgi:hypothetical protein
VLPTMSNDEKIINIELCRILLPMIVY